MTNDTFLQLFLAINAFALGVISMFAYNHWHRHLRPGSKSDNAGHANEPLELPPGFKEQLLKAAAKDLGSTLRDSTSQFSNDLDKTGSHLTGLLEKYGNDVVTDEMDLFQKRLQEIRDQAESSIFQVQNQSVEHGKQLEAEIAKKRAELEAQVQKEVAAYQQGLLNAIDQRLSDAVTSFLLENLGHEVDLGAQLPYLIAQLDEHKEELKREVGYEESTPTS